MPINYNLIGNVLAQNSLCSRQPGIALGISLLSSLLEVGTSSNAITTIPNRAYSYQE